MSKRESILLLDDMIISAEKIITYVEYLDFNTFMCDERTKDAVIRNFEIIGEAANRLDENFRIQNNNINWKRLRGFRNRIVHDYFGIDFEIVWSIIENDINPLISDVRLLVEKLREINRCNHEKFYHLQFINFNQTFLK